MEDGIPGRLQHHHETCCEKGGHRGRRACRVQRWHHCGDVVFRTGGLVYDSDVTSFRTIYSFLSYLVINVVTILSAVTDVTDHCSNPNYKF